jgi:hypothetical protein
MKVLVPVFYLPPFPPQKKRKTLVPGQARKPNTEERKLKIGGQVGRYLRTFIWYNIRIQCSMNVRHDEHVDNKERETIG